MRMQVLLTISTVGRRVRTREAFAFRLSTGGRKQFHGGFLDTTTTVTSTEHVQKQKEKNREKIEEK